MYGRIIDGLAKSVNVTTWNRPSLYVWSKVFAGDPSPSPGSPLPTPWESCPPRSSIRTRMPPALAATGAKASATARAKTQNNRLMTASLAGRRRHAGARRHVSPAGAKQVLIQRFRPCRGLPGEKRRGQMIVHDGGIVIPGGRGGML